MATREPGSDLIELVRELCRRAETPADDAEIRGALLHASAPEEAALRKLARRAPPARPLGPLAWLDVARGVAPAVAAARELGGYYALLAERDALAAMLQAKEPREVARPADRDPPRKPAPNSAPDRNRDPNPDRNRDPNPDPDQNRDPNRAPNRDPNRDPNRAPNRAPSRDPNRAPNRDPNRAPSRDPNRAPNRDPNAHAPAHHHPTLHENPDEHEPAVPVRVPRPSQEPRSAQAARAQHVLGLFAYHRDAPLVARALGLGMLELERELDRLKLRRKAARLVRGIDSDLPAATAIAGGRSGPPVRRRARDKNPTPAPPDAGAVLRAALKAIGPRRAALAARLELSAPELMERLREADLERQFADAERDLIRELYARHRGSQRMVARDLGLSESELKAILAERTLSREVEGLRERYRREARQDYKWPRDRIEQVLRERPLLEDLGVWDELHREVTVRAKLLWKDVRKKPDALALLQKTLRITPADARDLRRLLDLR